MSLIFKKYLAKDLALDIPLLLGYSPSLKFLALISKEAYLLMKNITTNIIVSYNGLSSVFLPMNQGTQL